RHAAPSHGSGRPGAPAQRPPAAPAGCLPADLGRGLTPDGGASVVRGVLRLPQLLILRARVRGVSHLARRADGHLSLQPLAAAFPPRPLGVSHAVPRVSLAATPRSAFSLDATHETADRDHA